ncbi:EAL domain-containing protein [Thiomicrorhabdus sediminis]|uniref:cyclic-guanylate-specific phosphodiesterase n=2 Tax=Thiomicrorhabdus sediminis TaxID=2580412 RepID=A0A4P9K715_9GAMM|nr:EAL domain-containing protein [Thiomicrorhabdus sediminis]
MGNSIVMNRQQLSKTYWINHLNLAMTALALYACMSLLPASATEAVFKAAVPKHFPPQYSTQLNGEPTGFAIDVLNAVAARANIKIDYQTYESWPQVMAAIDNNEVDLIPNLGITDARTPRYLFTDPIEAFPIVIFVRDTNSKKIKNIADLAYHTVGLVAGNVAKNHLKDNDSLTKITYPNVRLALFALLSGEVDAVIYPKQAFIGMANIIGVDNKIKIAGEPILEVKRAIATRKDHTKLISVLNSQLSSFIESKEFEEIYYKWHGKPKPYWNMERVSLLVIGSLLVIFIFVGLWRYFSLSKLNSRLRETIRQREKVESALTATQNLQRTLLDNLPDLVWLKDGNGFYLDCNTQFEKLIGKRREQIIGHSDFQLVSHQAAQNMRTEDLKSIAKGSAITNEEHVVYADGSEVEIETIKAPLFDYQGDLIGVLGVGRDITERKHYEEQVTRQAHFDNLTNLPNRFLILDRLSQMILDAKRENKMVGTMFVDLDDFKKVNDILGHDTGDAILLEASKRLCSTIRQGDSVGRIGSDEFVLIFGGLSDEIGLQIIAEKLLSRFKEPFTIKDRKLVITASIGISLYPNDTATPADLLRNADAAMLYAKNEGRNTYAFFTKSMNAGVTRRLQLEEHLYNAISNDEMQVFYQPKINLSTRRIVGAEALIRWSNEQLGAISPAEFIPLAEQTGVISEIGKFVISHALQTVSGWQKLYDETFNIAINLSPRQFKDNGLVQFIEQTMTAHHINGSTMEMEITEGVLMNAGRQVSNTLTSLNELGIKLSLDDFGTGYSSLSYLRHYPFDILKIDRSFINDINSDSEDYALVHATIDMAQALSLTVVAEGIETEEQLSALQEMQCPLGQGYLFGKPMPANEFEALLKQQSEQN